MPQAALALHQQVAAACGGPDSLAELVFIGEFVAVETQDSVADAQPCPIGRRGGQHLGNHDGARLHVVVAPADAKPDRAAIEVHARGQGFLVARAK